MKKKIRIFLYVSAPFLPILLLLLAIILIFIKEWELSVISFSLFLTSVAIYHNTQSRITLLLTNCYREIKELESRYYEKYEGKEKEGEMAWRSLFLNTLEFQAFLFNRNYLPKEEFLDFFGDVIKWGYEKILPKRPEDVTNRNKFPELKKLYAEYFKKGK